MTIEDNKPKESKFIKDKLMIITEGVDLEDYFRPEIYKILKESLDILDINYGVTAVGIIGKALETLIQEYAIKKLPKNKTGFLNNGGDFSISKIREIVGKTSHHNRLCLLNMQQITIGGKVFKLKTKVLTDKDFNELDAISKARNDSFHVCSEERYCEIYAESFVYLLRGASIMARIEKYIVYGYI